jgi:serine/threonine protein kinase
MINILSKINNKYLIKYYETFMENDTFNILMEYAGEKNLKQFIQDYRNKNELIDEKIIIYIILQICEGLKIIHDNKIIHRDLTPDNIFIDKNNKIKIGDFGVSKIMITFNNYAKTQIGKLNYLAPEILKGKDVYPGNEEALNGIDNPNFLVIKVDTYNSKELKLIEKEHPNSISYFGKAITYFANKNKK